MNNKIVKSIFEITLFIISLPILNILLKAIFVLGQALGSYTRMLGC